MPRKSSLGDSKRGPHAATLLAGALEKLAEKLAAESRHAGEIKSSTEIFNPASEALRSYRHQSMTIEQSVVVDVIQHLDSGGHQLCSRLDAPLHSIVIQVILQAEYCRPGERGMYLLAAALYHDSFAPPKPRTINKKKETIGKDCLYPMLNYFTNPSNNDGMRRWVGLLFLQLLQGCEENVAKLEMCPEDMRRRLGARLLAENNEILRVILSQIIRTMLDAGIGREHLWPVATHKKMYEGFPGSTPDNRGWNRLFQEYMDQIWPELSQPDASDLIFGAQNITTSPALKFGTRTRNVDVCLGADNILIWATSAPDTERFEQCLEISYDYVKGISIRGTGTSQDPNEAVSVYLTLDNDKDHFCYLDCVGTVMRQVVMVMKLQDTYSFAEDLVEHCPTASVQDEREDTQGNASRKSAGKAASRTSQSRDIITFADSTAEIDDATPAALSHVSRQSMESPGQDNEVEASKSKVRTEIPETQDLHADADKVTAWLDGSTHVDEETRVPEYEPSSPNQEDDEILKPSQVAATGAKLIAPKRARGVPKSKAKQPLVQSQKLPNSIAKDSTKPQLATSQGGGLASTATTKAQALPQQNQLDQLENSIAELRTDFPWTKNEQLRAALVASGGTIEGAARLLRKQASSRVKTPPQMTMYSARSKAPITRKAVGTVTGTSTTQHPLSSDKSRADDGFDTASITSPEVNDASTPKKRKVQQVPTTKASNAATVSKRPVTKKVAKYSLKPSAPLIIDKQEASIPIAKVKGNVVGPKSRKSAPANDYDIPTDDDEEDIGISSTRIVTNPTNAGKKALLKNAGVMKAAPKKRKSAPGMLQRPLGVRRSTRTAAATASQRLQGADASDEEAEELEETFAKPEPKAGPNRKTKAQLVSKQPLKLKAANLTSVPDVRQDDEELLTQEKEDARSLGLMMDDLPIPLSESLYDTSPQPSQTFKAKKLVEAPRRGTKSFGDTRDISSKLENIFSDLTEPAEEIAIPFEALPTRQKATKKRTEIPSASAQAMPPPMLKMVHEVHVKVEKGNKVPTKIHDERLREALPREKSTIIVIEDDESSSSGADEEAVAESRHILSSSNSKKRMAPESVETTTKRRQTQVDPPQMNEGVTLRRSPRNHKSVGAQKARNTNASRQAKKITPTRPTRSSPRLAARSKDASAGASVERSLVDDHLARKQTVISFGANGPRNQGLASARKEPIPNMEITEPTESSPVIPKSTSERKRKRQADQPTEEQAADIQSPPRKRLSISPDDGVQAMMSSPMQMASSPPKSLSVCEADYEKPVTSKNGSSRFKKRSMKANSQSSRVDENGSPIPIGEGPQIDYFGNAKRKLRGIGESFSEANIPAEVSPALFGPKVVLGGIAKAGPSSPAEADVRYVPHKKTQSGLYEGVSTNEIVAPDEKLPDPFTDKLNKTPSGFTDRLLAGSSYVKKALRPGQDLTNKMVQPEKEKLAHPPKPSPRGPLMTRENIGIQPKLARMLEKDPEKTLVNDENDPPSLDSPSENTSGMSNDGMESRSSQAATKSDAWNAALRPHYSKMHDAIHRIADEVIIRLAKEEDALELMVNQYEENGTRLIDNHARNRDLQKENIEKQLDVTRGELVAIYDEVKGFVDETKEKIEHSKMAGFEKQWLKEQDSIQRQIDEGRLGVDG